MEEQSKTHMWIIVLLIWAIVLLAFGVGYLVYTQQQPQEADLPTSGQITTAACDEALATVRARAETEKNTAVAEAEAACVTTLTYEGDASYPRFLYPVGWHISLRNDGDRPISIMHISPKPITISDSTTTPISIVADGNTTSTLEEYFTGTYTAGNGYGNIVKGSAAFGATSALVITGTFEDPSSSTTTPVALEEILYRTDEQLIRIRYLANSTQADEETAEAWSMLRNSLNFTPMK